MEAYLLFSVLYFSFFKRGYNYKPDTIVLYHISFQFNRKLLSANKKKIYGACPHAHQLLPSCHRNGKAKKNLSGWRIEQLGYLPCVSFLMDQCLIKYRTTCRLHLAGSWFRLCELKMVETGNWFWLFACACKASSFLVREWCGSHLTEISDSVFSDILFIRVGFFLEIFRSKSVRIEFSNLTYTPNSKV